MPYCNWCMLDSDSDDFCVWCKRPLGTSKGVYQQSRTDLHFLRQTDDEHESAPVFAIVGVLVFMCLIAGAVILFRNKDNSAADSQQWVLKDQADQEQLAQQQQQAVQQQAQAEQAARPAIYAPAPTPPQTPQYTPQKQAQGGAPQPPPNFLVSPGDYVLPNRLSAHSESGLVKNDTLYFESVDFKPVADNAGVKHLIGNVVVVNDTYGNVQGGQLWVMAGASKFPLVRYDGSINAPHVLKDFALASKASMVCHVTASGLNPDIKFAGKKIIGMDAKLEGQPVHIEAEVVSRG